MVSHNMVIFLEITSKIRGHYFKGPKLGVKVRAEGVGGELNEGWVRYTRDLTVQNTNRHTGKYLKHFRHTGLHQLHTQHESQR